MVPPLVRCIITDAHYATGEAKNWDEYMHPMILTVNFAIYRQYHQGQFRLLKHPIYIKKDIHEPLWYYTKGRSIQVFSTKERRITPWRYRDGDEDKDSLRASKRLTACMLGLIDYTRQRTLDIQAGMTFTAFYMNQQGKLPGIQRFWWTGESSGGEIFPEPFAVTMPTPHTINYALKLYQERTV